MRPAVFFIYDSLAALLSVPLLVYAAYFFGDRIEQVIRWAHRSEYGILVIVAVVVGLFVVKGMRKRKAKKLGAAAAPKAAEVTPKAPGPLPRTESPAKAP